MRFPDVKTEPSLAVSDQESGTRHVRLYYDSEEEFWNCRIASENAGSQYLYSNTTGYVTANENITFTFTNTEASIVAPTAVKNEGMSLVVMMISSATCLAGAVVHNERKKKGGQDVSTND